MITHANVVAFVEWAIDYFGTKAGRPDLGPPAAALRPLDLRHLRHLPRGRRAAPRAGGGEPRCPRSSPSSSARRELTQWFAVPSIFTYMAKFDVIAHGDFPSLERVLWCGEVLPTPVLIHWMERLPHATFTNLYGPTEATIASSYYTVPELPASETEPIPIGVPVRGRGAARARRGQLEPVPAGEIGDLYIAGVGLSPGYWRDEEKTEAAFVPDPALDAPGSGSTGPATWRERGSTTGSSTSSAARTRRSRAAATGSSWARSRPRSTRSARCASAPSSASTRAASRARRSAAPTRPPRAGGRAAAAARGSCARSLPHVHAALALARARRAAEERQRQDRPRGAAASSSRRAADPARASNPRRPRRTSRGR